MAVFLEPKHTVTEHQCVSTNKCINHIHIKQGIKLTMTEIIYDIQP